MWRGLVSRLHRKLTMRFEEAQAAEKLEDALRVAHDHGVATEAGDSR